MKFIIVFCLLAHLTPPFFLSAGCSYTSISTRQHQVVFHYTNQLRSEKDLPICEENSVCSVLYKRYWFPTISDRLCRCANSYECPWKWTDKHDNQTMVLNNRSQLKFCTPITNYNACNSQKAALRTVKKFNPVSKHYEIKINCYCSADHRWKHFKTIRHITISNDTTEITDEFKCVPLKVCQSREVCGNIRADHNSIYYRCSCPVDHLCLKKDKNVKSVDELLYKGPAFKAVCEPQKEGYDSYEVN